MHYKLYRYELTKIVGEKEREVHPDGHFKLFQRSRGADAFGELAEYRGKRDSVLMFVREYRSDFVGLIGRHSTEREVTTYDPKEDETYQIEVDDDDYGCTCRDAGKEEGGLAPYQPGILSRTKLEISDR